MFLAELELPNLAASREAGFGRGCSGRGLLLLGPLRSVV
jgi:hypothetical protein